MKFYLIVGKNQFGRGRFQKITSVSIKPLNLHVNLCGWINISNNYLPNVWLKRCIIFSSSLRKNLNFFMNLCTQNDRGTSGGHILNILLNLGCLSRVGHKIGLVYPKYRKISEFKFTVKTSNFHHLNYWIKNVISHGFTQGSS